MSEHDLEKLLGGFTADTLTPEEKQELYNAALQDQQLFNVLADEQALKELLSDSDVRRRLLTSLAQKSASGTGSSLSWLDWFRRPAGLAFAGGLAAAALAVVLGVRIYQDSLRQSAQSVATEEVKPATTQAVESHAKARESLAPATDLPKKDMMTDKPVTQDRSTPPLVKKEQASDLARESPKHRNDQAEIRSGAKAPVAARAQPTDEMTSSADQKLAASSAPLASALEAKQMQGPASGRIANPVTASLSARDLFYSGESARADARLMATEQEQARKPLAESVPQANRPEPSLERLSQPGKAAGTAAHARHLGLRYSFVVRGTDGQEREVDPAAAKNIQPLFLTMEANQDAYLQVW